MPSAIKKRYSVDELGAIATPIAKKHGVNRVYIFGSVARGDYNENSDYDFYIELNEVWVCSGFPVFSRTFMMRWGAT